MQTIGEVREHCRFVSEGIEKMVAEGEAYSARSLSLQFLSSSMELLRRRSIFENFVKTAAQFHFLLIGWPLFECTHDFIISQRWTSIS